MKLSLSQAAKETGKSKPTISKAIKTGRLSAEKVGTGYQIDTAELFRVYPMLPATSQVKETPRETSVAVLEMEAKMLREQLERERETVDDLRERLNRAERLIADQRPAVKRKWFWERN